MITAYGYSRSRMVDKLNIYLSRISNLYKDKHLRPDWILLYVHKSITELERVRFQEMKEYMASTYMR